MIVNIAIFFMTVFISTDASAQSTRSEIFYKKIDECREQAMLQAQADCASYGLCDYDINARTARIYSCFYNRENSPWICDLTFAEEAEFRSAYGKKNGPEILKHIADGWCPERIEIGGIHTLIFKHPEFPAFYIYKNNNREVITNHSENYEDYNSMWVKNSEKIDCP